MQLLPSGDLHYLVVDVHAILLVLRGNGKVSKGKQSMAAVFKTYFVAWIHVEAFSVAMVFSAVFQIVLRRRNCQSVATRRKRK